MCRAFFAVRVAERIFIMWTEQKLDEMLDIAELLADGKNFIRVDLYVINGDVYFSEFTFFSDAGFERFYPDEWDYTLGKWIDL